MRIVSIDILKTALLFSLLMGTIQAVTILFSLLSSYVVLLLSRTFSSGMAPRRYFELTANPELHLIQLSYVIGELFGTFLVVAFFAAMFNFLAPKFGGIRIGMEEPEVSQP